MQYKKQLTLSSAGLLFAMVLLGSVSVTAQSLIFNVPSTDVLEKGKTNVEFDWFAHLESHANGGSAGYMPRFTHGLGKGLEVGLNAQFLDAADPQQPVQIQPNLKWQAYNNEKHGVAVTVGGIAYVNVRNRQGADDDYGFLYTNVSKKFKGDYGPRLTAGYYRMAGVDEDFGNQGGLMLGYEQPLHPKVSFSVDWLAGDNAFGYLTPAVNVYLPKNSYVFAGWLIGNQGRKNNYLYLGYGVTF